MLWVAATNRGRYRTNNNIRRVRDRKLRTFGLKFWFMGQDGKTVYAASRRAAMKARSYDMVRKFF